MNRVLRKNFCLFIALCMIVGLFSGLTFSASAANTLITSGTLGGVTLSGWDDGGSVTAPKGVTATDVPMSASTVLSISSVATSTSISYIDKVKNSAIPVDGDYVAMSTVANSGVFTATINTTLNKDIYLKVTPSGGTASSYYKITSTFTGTISTAKVNGFVAPVLSATPIGSSALLPESGSNFTVQSIVWHFNSDLTNPASYYTGGYHYAFIGKAIYSAKVVLVASSGSKFSSSASASVDVGTVSKVDVASDGSSMTLTVTFSETESRAQKPVIVTQPYDSYLTSTSGTTYGQLFVGAWVGDGGTILYQWYYSPYSDMSYSTEISGATTAYYTPTQAGYYRVRLQNYNYGFTTYYSEIASSNTVYVSNSYYYNSTSGYSPVITTDLPATKSANLSESVTFSVVASVSYGSITYQWYRISETGVTTRITSATSSSYTISNITQSDNNTSYYCILTNSYYTNYSVTSTTCKFTIRNHYIVTYNTQGGNTIDAANVTKGAAATAPATPVRAGYSFAGWYRDAACTNLYDFATILTGDITLYAKWNVLQAFDDTTLPNTLVYNLNASGSVNSAGVCTVSITADALNSVYQTSLNNISGKSSLVQVTVQGDDNASGVNVTLPRTSIALIASNTDSGVRIKTSKCSIVLDTQALNSIVNAGNGDITVSVSRLTNANIPEDVKAAVGTHPVFSFTMQAGSVNVSDFNNGTARVSIPYALATSENKDAIVVYKTDSGKGVPVRSIYNTNTNSVEFVTRGFSTYAMAYNPVSFDDVPANDANFNYILYVASHGIVEGIGGNKYAPNDSLTREQFLIMVMKAYGLSADATPQNNFSDVPASAYYAGYVSAAKRLGITAGIGNNKFGSGRTLTNQEMYTMLFNALKALNESPSVQSGPDLSTFGDAGSVADWAVPAMRFMTKANITSGIASGNNLAPKTVTTRGSMAHVIYNLMSAK